MEAVYNRYEKLIYSLAWKMSLQFTFIDRDELISLARYEFIKLIPEINERQEGKTVFIYKTIKNKLLNHLKSYTAHHRKLRHVAEHYFYLHSEVTPDKLIFDKLNVMSKEAKEIVNIILKTPNEIANFETLTKNEIKKEVKKIAIKRGIKNINKYFKEIKQTLMEDV